MTDQTEKQSPQACLEDVAQTFTPHGRLILSEEYWNLVISAAEKAPVPNNKLKRAARRLKNME